MDRPCYYPHNSQNRDFISKLLFERPYCGTNPVVLYNAAKNNRFLLQRFRLVKNLNSHQGCVNTISWNSTGRYILSGSDDLHLSITDAFTGVVQTQIRTGHLTNIFSAKYLPNTSDSKVVSCSGDGVIIYTDLNRPETAVQNIFNCQEESVYDIVTVPGDPNTFLTCGHDFTVRWYDLRVKQSCQKHPMRVGRLYGRGHKCSDDVLITCTHPVTAIAVNQLVPWQLAIGCSDSIIRIFDRRMLSTKLLGGGGKNQTLLEQNNSIVAKFTYDGLKDSNRITSLAYSRDCQQILASYSNDNLYLFNLYEVRDTISNGYDCDVISEKPRRNKPPYKRFRLRGDWSDTGPGALSNEEIRNVDQQSNNNNSGSSTNANSSQSSGSLNQSSTSSASGNQSGGRNNERMRQLNTILSLLFRNSFRGSNETLNNDSAGSDELQNSSSSSSTTSIQGSSNSQTPASASGRAAGERANAADLNADNNSESGGSSDNSLGYFIQIFDDGLDYPYYSNGNDDDNEEEGDANAMDEDEEDEEEEFDSDTTNDSVFNHDSFATASNFGGGRHRSRSSSSNDSRQRKTRNVAPPAFRIGQPRQVANRPSLFNNANFKDEIRNPNRICTAKKGALGKRLRTYKIKNYKRFTGHRNSRTVIKEATFWGDDYIISGSDCGHIFFWSIETGEVVMILEGDRHVVNCLQPHPTDPILASSGIDYDVKIWAPHAQENRFDSEKAKKLMSRNKHLLQESRDTVTVPARFVLSLFSSIRQRIQQRREQEAADASSNNNNSGNGAGNGDGGGNPSSRDEWVQTGNEGVAASANYDDQDMDDDVR